MLSPVNVVVWQVATRTTTTRTKNRNVGVRAQTLLATAPGSWEWYIKASAGRRGSRGEEHSRELDAGFERQREAFVLLVTARPGEFLLVVREHIEEPRWQGRPVDRHPGGSKGCCWMLRRESPESPSTRRMGYEWSLVGLQTFVNQTMEQILRSHLRSPRCRRRGVVVVGRVVLLGLRPGRRFYHQRRYPMKKRAASRLSGDFYWILVGL